MLIQVIHDGSQGLACRTTPRQSQRVFRIRDVEEVVPVRCVSIPEHMPNPGAVDSFIRISTVFDDAGHPEPLAHAFVVAAEHGHLKLNGFSGDDPVGRLDSGGADHWDVGVLGWTEGAHESCDVVLEDGH